MFGFSNKLSEIQEEVVMISMLGYLYIPSLYVNLSFLLVDDTLLKNMFLLKRVIVKS